MLAVFRVGGDVTLLSVLIPMVVGFAVWYVDGGARVAGARHFGWRTGNLGIVCGIIKSSAWDHYDGEEVSVVPYVEKAGNDLKARI